MSFASSTALVNNQPPPFVPRKRSKLYIYYSTMGYLFQIVRDIDPKLRTMIDTFTLIGLIYTVRLAARFFCSSISGFRTHIWSRVAPINLTKRYGKWAVITGATDGVGLEYARQMSKRGLALILIGRNPQKLDDVRQELMANSKNEVVTIQADLNSNDPALYRRILTEIKADERDIGILVNNAGVMYDSPNRFLDQPESKLWQQMQVNMMAVVMMSRIVLPSMVKKKRGLVINMSSIAAYQPLPLMGLYSASKVFVEWFSQSLEIEYKKFGIEVQTIIPNYISTKMTTFSGMLQTPSVSCPNARTYTANAIATIGRSSLTTGYWFHELQHFFVKQFMPYSLYRSISYYFLQYIDDSKQRK